MKIETSIKNAWFEKFFTSTIFLKWLRLYYEPPRCDKIKHWSKIIYLQHTNIVFPGSLTN